MAQTDDRMVAALLRERDGYLRTGQSARAAMVEEQLRLRGWVDPDAAGDSRREPPRARSAQPRRSTGGHSAS